MTEGQSSLECSIRIVAISDIHVLHREASDCMRKELEQRIVERWPTWFRVDGNVRETLMPFGFAHGDGDFATLNWPLSMA